MATPKQHIEEIRRSKFSIGGSRNPLTEDLHQAVMNLSGELYAKDVHFLMELIQNAEDNEYAEGVDPSLEFVITSQDITATGAPATLLIFNNEIGFTPRNIDSICSVGRSTKKGNRGRGYIGEKGIGFKSVFLITAQPYIFSNGYQIRFTEGPCPHCNVGYIVPEWVKKNPTPAVLKRIHGNGTPLPTTTIILPLKPDKIQSVKHQLSNIHPEILLFLTKIKRLSVREVNEDPSLNTVSAVSILSETNFVTRKNIDAESYMLYLSADDSGDADLEKECGYHMWRQRFPVKKNHKVERRMEVEEWVITLAFPSGKRLLRGMQSPGIYAFLPTEMVTNFPFIIQADFILASSRENILLDNKWNKGILDCVSSAFISAFTSLVKDTEAPISTLPHIFKFLPVNEGPCLELNAVRESIRQKLLNQSIVPCESYSEQKFFHKPREVGGILPSFWDILDKARGQGVAFNNISSHGTYILSSSFDIREYNQILEFMGVKLVAYEWYANCIQSSNIVLDVSEDVYLELLLFVSENWESGFHATTMKNVSLLKYVDIHGNVSLTSVSIVSRCDAGKLFRSTEKRYASWLINWSSLFKSATGHFFMPISTQQAIGLSSKKRILLDWLSDQAKVKAVSVYDYALLLTKLINNDREIAIAYSHFLYHSFSKKYVSEENVKEICSSMPLVDSYGRMVARQFVDSYGRTVAQQRKVLLPANGSNWVELIGSNIWRGEGYVELGKDYLQPVAYFGIPTKGKTLINFLKKFVPAFDIPQISPPDAVISTMSAPLTKQNAFLLLDWIRYLRRNRFNIPQKLLSCIKEGSWLKISLNGSSGYRPPSQSFMFSSSGAYDLQQESELVDIPLVDQKFYGNKINDYKEELGVVGVMFAYNEACRFIGNQLMSIASSSNLTRESVLSILQFIKFLRVKLLSPAEFINSIKGGRWLRTSQGDRAPDESVLYNEEWEAASEVSNIPFIDEFYYGANLMSFKEELELIGVKVNFNGNYQLVGDNLKSSACSSPLTPKALCLMLDCLRNLKSTNKFVDVFKDKKCIKTHVGVKTPSECYLPDSQWGCLLQVFSCFPLIDEIFYGSEIFWFKDELKQIGVVLDFEEASKKFEVVFRQQSSLHFIGKVNALTLLQCYKKLKTSNPFPADLKKCIREEKWLRTRLGDYRAPTDCILFGKCWKSISSISLLPFIDDSDNQYGMTIHKYDKELKSMGVVSSFKDGAHFVVNGLNFPQDPSKITPENVYSLLECIRSYKPESDNLKNHELFPSSFLEKIGRQWLKTYTGYSSTHQSMLFSSEWADFLEKSDGPVLDEGFYGSRFTEYKNELRSLGVVVDIRNGCSLLANYLDSHSRFATVSRIYNYLIEFKWKPNDGDNRNIWIPSDSENGQWVSSEDCVIQDKNGLLGSRLHVLEKYYNTKLLNFFSTTYGVKLNPSIDDYCEIWKTWEASGHQLTHDEACAFWWFVVKNWSLNTEKILTRRLLKLPVYSGSNAINLVDKHDVFIADDLQLKDLFEKSSFGSLFVWYPQTSMRSLPRTKLLEIYSKIGVRNISESVKQELSLVDTVNLKQLNPKELFIGKGLLRLILGFLSEVSPRMEANIRHEVVRRLLDVTVFEAGEPITMFHSLSLSSGKTLNVEARQMLRWERQVSKLFVQKLDKDGGHKNIMEYASHFSEVVAGGLLWENENNMRQLADLIRLGFLVEFNEDAVMYLMKMKNLQIFSEDEELLSSSFPDDKVLCASEIIDVDT
ncbi:Histidine kinase-like ATPase, C-terminal domain containing protein [Heracleum sosnowskyi]|uniref:Histidine kinase-like ATPase, C-terminal domain containing protein n=1 Tax=Heracleum sosnowskyi TaxID=360622 RepID=A0AAD8M8E6_9APIA|nr:Histidine kinase-like ATPase, C-terminal domain containing protein [Heracleum sosnowskyi]